MRKVVDVRTSVHVHVRTILCSDKNANKKENSLLDLFEIFLAKSNKMARISKKSTGFPMLTLFYRIHVSIFFTI